MKNKDLIRLKEMIERMLNGKTVNMKDYNIIATAIELLHKTYQKEGE